MIGAIDFASYTSTCESEYTITSFCRCVKPIFTIKGTSNGFVKRRGGGKGIEWKREPVLVWMFRNFLDVDEGSKDVVRRAIGPPWDEAEVRIRRALT